jgi:uncharacterized protein YjbI with pentapeptide repeats
MINSAASARGTTMANETGDGINFRYRDLRSRDFSSESLKNADFTGADLRGCKFQSTDLSGSNFQAAQIGLDSSQFFSLLLESFKAVAPMLLLFSFALFIGASSEGAWDNSSGSGSDNSADDRPVNPIHGTWMPMLAVITCIALVIAGIGLYLFLAYNINQDSVGYFYVWITGSMGVASGALLALIAGAGSLAKTDFSGARLDLAQIDRSAFHQAKTTEAEIERVTWL